jgi:steroid 5-alpha reductase family enzyme
MILALAHNLAAILLLMLLLWRVAVAIRDVSFIDAVWALGMVFLTAITAFLLLDGPRGPLGWLLLGLTSLWGLRLGLHLLARWRRLGRDPRYDKILAVAQSKRGWSFSKAALLQVFLLQGPLVWLVSLPAQAGLLTDPGTAPGTLALAGAALALFGIAFETIGDAQLEAFRKDPASHGKVLDTGLWRYTRHPNYFGDACAWWGIWAVGIAAGAPLWVTLGPIFLTYTLTRWSGAPMLEHGLKRSRPGYEDYVRRTSGFIPLPPKRS